MKTLLRVKERIFVLIVPIIIIGVILVAHIQIIVPIHQLDSKSEHSEYLAIAELNKLNREFAIIIEDENGLRTDFAQEINRNSINQSLKKIDSDHIKVKLTLYKLIKRKFK